MSSLIAKISKIFRSKVFLAAVFVVCGFFMSNWALAMSENITQINFTTSPQTINSDVVSATLSTQTQNASGLLEQVSETTKLILNSSSPTGQFSSNSANWHSVAELTMSKNSANRNFYYRDSTAGVHTLTVSAQGWAWTATSQKIIIVAPPNNAPILSSVGNRSVDESSILTFTATSTDIDGGAPTYSLAGAPASASINSSTGVFTWTPSEAEGSGSYTFDVIVFDGNGGTDSETITVTVNEVNNVPAVSDISIFLTDDAATAITLTSTDADLPANILTYAILATPSHGTLSGTAPNLFYTPFADSNGLDSFTFKVNDGIADSNIATTSITVNIIKKDNVSPAVTLNGKNVLNIYAGSVYADAGATASDNVDGDITAKIIVSNNVDSANVGTYTVAYNVSDTAGNRAREIIRTVKVLPVSASARLLGEKINVDANAPDIFIGDNNISSSTISIPDNVNNATINVFALATSTATSTRATFPCAITINASTTIGSVGVKIPAGIQIVAGTSTWNGIINVPQVKSNDAVAVTADSGNTAAVFSVIEIGYGDIKLTFDKAVRIVLFGQAGKEIGYSRSGIFTKINDVCSTDTQVAGDALPSEGDCKISVAPDLIVWTKHFTNFVTYAQTAIPAVATVATAPSAGGNGSPFLVGAASARVRNVDTNNDGKIDILDFVTLMANWGASGTGNIADFNGDGKVDILDFVRLMANWSR